MPPTLPNRKIVMLILTYPVKFQASTFFQIAMQFLRISDIFRRSSKIAYFSCFTKSSRSNLLNQRVKLDFAKPS